MKEKITSLVLVLVVAMSMTVGASAASYIPDDVTYQNLNGQQLAIKTYTLLPDQNPADLYEEDFEHDGFLYSMSDIIKEEQAKLGFFREDIRLYYPLSSLNHFFDAADTADEMQARLEVLPASITDKLGDIEVSHKGDRFCFHIPQQGTVYVHDNTAGNEFIKELVNLVGRHGCTMDEILDLFHTHSDNVITEEMDNGEFDRLIRFGDKPDDIYYYCFKDEGCHIIYHRFLPEDYADFDF